jgi:hypothetical protein
MSRRVAGWIAGALALATLALAIGSPLVPTRDGVQSAFEDVLWGGVWLTFSAVGALIVTRRPEVSLGWLFCAFPVAWQLWVVAEDYAVWIAAVSLPVVLVCASLLLLLYPTGRPGTRGNRLAVTAVLVNGAVLFVARAITPGSVSQSITLEHPLGIEPLGPVVEPLVAVTTTAAILGLIAALGSVFLRRRRARGVERRQLDWFAYAVALLAVAWVAGAVLQAAGYNEGAGTSLVYVLGIVSLPIAMGIAVLRYRLYDIEVVIRRTLVYGALTATLGAVYLGLVLLSGLAAGDTDLAVAASTLAVAVLFRPARARIQALVDRRFYRRRYDAEQTLATFRNRLRDELDLDAIGGELRRVAGDSLQPAHVSLWLPRNEFRTDGP